MPYTRLAALMLIMTTLAAAGCSESKSKKPAGGANTQTGAANAAVTRHSTQALTRAELIAQGDAICRQLNQRAASIVTTSLHTVGTTAVPLAGYYRVALAELRTLTPPATMASAWRAIVADIQKAPDAITTMGRFALDNDMASTVRAELKLKKIQQHRFAIARHNGFTDCGEV